VVGESRKLPRFYEREVRDLPWSEYRTTVVIELYRKSQTNRILGRARVLC
jgi:hypothetical protein